MRALSSLERERETERDRTSERLSDVMALVRDGFTGLQHALGPDREAVRLSAAHRCHLCLDRWKQRNRSVYYRGFSKLTLAMSLSNITADIRCSLLLSVSVNRNPRLPHMMLVYCVLPAKLCCVLPAKLCNRTPTQNTRTPTQNRGFKCRDPLDSFKRATMSSDYSGFPNISEGSLVNLLRTTASPY